MYVLAMDPVLMFGDKILQGHAHLKTLPLDEPINALLSHLKDKSNDENCCHPLAYNELMNGIKNGLKI